MLRIVAFICLVIAVFTLGQANAYGHSGGLNSSGCHNNRSTGGYHCHRSSNTPAPRNRNARTQRENATPTPESGTRVEYKNCTAAREAGVTPIRRGEPGYASHLDRDNDGIACE